MCIRDSRGTARFTAGGAVIDWPDYADDPILRFAEARLRAWAELAGTVTNRKGLVQRMHAAFPPPGQAIPGWEAVVRLAGATGVKFSWTHAREVFKDMTGKVSELSGHTWVREARPLQLRFAGSRG